MSSTSIKTLSKRIPTKHSGIYYKEVQQTTIDDHGKVKTKIIDKVYVIRYRSDNKQHLVTLGKYSEGIREAYCKTKRDEYLTMARNGEVPPQVKKRIKKQVITLDSVADNHYRYKALHNRNNNHAKNRYRLHIKPMLGNKDIAAITISDVENLQQIKGGKFSPKTVNNIMSELSAVFTYAIKHSVVSVNPVKQVDKLEVDNERERYLSKDEVRKLLKAVQGDERLYTFILIALNTGARVGAICKLTAKDIDFKAKKIDMLDEKKKKKKEKTYPCYLQDRQLIEMLNKRIKTVGEDKPILDDGKDIDGLTDRVKHQVARVLNRLFNPDKIEKKDRVVVHTLRHTFASHLVLNGIAIYTVKKLMNHSSIEMTERYAKLAPDVKAEAVKGLYR